MLQEKMKAEAEEFNFKIREMENTHSDAQLLADCFNTFDDPKSWPGGFGHGDPFTAERILEGLEKSTPLAKYVAFCDGKIVGHCDVLEHFTEEDIVYVGLLGVDPEYQGKKIGKNLLLYATNKAVELEKNEITLHTWGGNLKAVPLYKKTGYFWAPESSVYMENFLPAILRYSYFKSFFEKYDWYTTFVRELDLTPDKEKITDMDIYSYKFVADENNSLEVIIDVRAKRISGFTLKTKEGTIGLKSLTENSIGYTGFKPTKVIWEMTNKTSKAVQFNLRFNLSKGITFEDEPETKHQLEPGEIKSLEAKISVADDVETVDDPRDCHERADLILESLCQINEQEVDLAIGLVPVDPLEVEVYPKTRSLIPGEATEIPVRIWNRTNEKMAISMILSEIDGVVFQERQHTFTINPQEAINQRIKLKISDTFSKNLIQLNVNLFREDKKEKTKLPDETLYFPVLSTATKLTQNLTGFIKKGKYVILENNLLRVKIRTKGEALLAGITDKRDNTEYDMVYHGGLDLGLPFIGWANEFSRMKPTVELIQKENRISVILTNKSEVKPGIKIDRIFTLFPQKDRIKITAKITNESNKTQKDIALKITTDSWSAFSTEGKLSLPLERGLLHTSDLLNLNSSRHFPREKNEWKESWTCMQYEGSKLLGLIWDTEYLKTINLNPKKTPDFEFYFGTLEPGQVRESEYSIYLTRGNWKDFRGEWKRIVKKDNSVDFDIMRDDLKEVKQFTLKTESKYFGEADMFNIQALNYSDSLKLDIINNTCKRYSGKLTIELPKGITFENNENRFEEEINELDWDNSYNNEFEIHANEIYHGRIVPIKMILEVTGFSYDLTFLAVIVNKDTKIKVEQQKTDDKELIIIDNGRINFSGSKDHAGSITSLRLPTITKTNNILTSWPEPKPFLWYSKWFGGITPNLRRPSGWGGIIEQEEFSSELVNKGQVKGVKFISELQSQPLYKGLKIEFEYTTLPYSNIMKATLRVHNSNNTYSKFIGGLQGVIAVSERVDNEFYFKQNNEIVKRSSHASFYTFKKKNKWVVYTDKESKMAMAVLGPDNKNLHLEITDNSELMNSIYTDQTLIIPPKGLIEYSLLFILYPLNHELLTYLDRYY